MECDCPVLGLILAMLDVQLNVVPTGIPMLIIISWSLAKYLHQDEGYVQKSLSELNSFKLSLISQGTFFIYTNLL